MFNCYRLTEKRFFFISKKVGFKLHADTVQSIKNTSCYSVVNTGLSKDKEGGFSVSYLNLLWITGQLFSIIKMDWNENKSVKK